MVEYRTYERRGKIGIQLCAGIYDGFYVNVAGEDYERASFHRDKGLTGIEY